MLRNAASAVVSVRPAAAAHSGEADQSVGGAANRGQQHDHPSNIPQHDPSTSSEPTDGLHLDTGRHAATVHLVAGLDGERAALASNGGAG
jgi:hypothetical protein